MRFASWNINGTKARLGYVEAWLRAVKPDIVGLQELKTPDDKFPADVFRALGYHAVTHGQKSWNGVAILARDAPEVITRGLPGQEDMGARLITARVSGVTFTTVYVPNGKDLEHADFPKKLAFLDALGAHVAEHFNAEAPHVLCGDFNVVPAPIDSWSEEFLGNGIFHTDEERARVARLLDWGFVDAYRHLYPEEPGFTWWDYRAGAFHRKQGLRIDLMLVTRGLSERVREVNIERDWRKKLDGMIPSDHAPVWADIALD
jgi:exodeoxyribonuclease-3